jgi:hypothetical protein
VLTGSARVTLEQREQEEGEVLRRQDVEREKLALQSKRQAMAGQIAALRAQFAAEQKAAERALMLAGRREKRMQEERTVMARSRKVGS